MQERQDHRIFWIVVFALLLLSRIPAMASYLSIDNVNLALSLEKFDPRIDQPQPPGYPFFVLSGRIVNFFVRDAGHTFTVISLLVCALCLPAAFALGKRMFSNWAGAAAVLLLLVNPVFWHSTLDGPLRPYLALFSLLTAYCCWRCWNGEKRFALWGAVALGIGSGFRPDLGAFLFPLWAISSWAGTKSCKILFQAAAVLAALVAVWAGALVFAMGGVQSFIHVMLDYTVDQSRPESIVFGSSILSWLKQVNRLVIWNGLAVVTWIWAIPFYFRNRDRLRLNSPQAAFFLVWLVPGLIVQALIHVGAPGHTLASVAALCVLGGYVLSLARSRDVLLSGALILNVMLFLDFFPLPEAISSTQKQAPSLKNAALFGAYESSIGMVRTLDDVAGSSLKELRELTPADRPSMIVTTDANGEQWFLHWQIARYYLPDRDLWVLYNGGAKNRAERIRRDQTLEKREEGAPVKVPVFREGRILWLIEPQSAIYRQLASTQKLNGGRYVFYTDITADSPPIRIDDFEIVPAGIQ
ncbi:MAG TPA: hypothetical protein VGK48_19040 [Terriglobia bacterium]|jgi:hypothetical protein